MPEVSYDPDTDEILQGLRKAAYKDLDRKRRLGQHAIIGDPENLGKTIRLKPDEIGDYLASLDKPAKGKTSKPLAKAV